MTVLYIFFGSLAVALIFFIVLANMGKIKSVTSKMLSSNGAKSKGGNWAETLKKLPWITAPIGLCIFGFAIAALTTFFFSENYEVDVYFVAGANAPCIRSNAIPGEGGVFVLDSYETRQIRVPVGHRGCASSDPVGVVSWSRRNGEILVIGGPDTGPR